MENFDESVDTDEINELTNDTEKQEEEEKLALMEDKLGGKNGKY